MREGAHRQLAPRLLEINSHPAIGDGTMSGVPPAVYTRLVGDVLTLLVLPALDVVGSFARRGLEVFDGDILLLDNIGQRLGHLPDASKLLRNGLRVF